MNILNYIEFLNEGLISTKDANIVISKTIFLPKNIIYDINHTKSDNLIHFKILHFNKLSEIFSTFDSIESYFINMMGWFPSTMIVKNLSGMENSFKYNREYLIENMEFLDNVEIIFESKFDHEVSIPKKLYHLSIQEFKSNILKRGLSPKSKSKLSYHDDRIYVCKKKFSCYNLIKNMKMFYISKKWTNPKNKINYKWVIYEINTDGLELKLYSDPNYIDGYYLLSNIPPNNIKVLDEE